MQQNLDTNMPLREILTNSWGHIQGFLFPMLRESVGPLTAQHERLVVVLDVALVEAFVQMWPGLPGRPPKDLHALARAFVAKAVLDLATTSGLIERLTVDATLRRLCGFERASQVPSESTFSRAFAEFAQSSLPASVNEALIKRTNKDRIVGHIARDATAIDGREKAVKFQTPDAPKGQKRKRGRPKTGEVVARPTPRRLERQTSQTLPRCSPIFQLVATSARRGTPRGIRRVGSATSCTSIRPTATSRSPAC